MIADALFMICHDRRGGKPRRNPRHVALALAGATLADLYLGQHLEIVGEHLRIHPHHLAPRDPFSRYVFDTIRTNPLTSDMAFWLSALSMEVGTGVGERLADTGVVVRRERLTLRGRRTRYVPVNSNDAAIPSVRLASYLGNPKAHLTYADVILGVLVQQLGLLNEVLWQKEHRDLSHDRLRRFTAGLPSQMHTLIEQVEVAVGAAVLAPR